MGRPTRRTEPPALLPENLALDHRSKQERTPGTNQPGDAADHANRADRTAPAEPMRDPDPDERGRPVRSTPVVTEDAEAVRRVQETLHARHDLRADDLVMDVVNGVAYLSGSSTTAIPSARCGPHGPRAGRAQGPEPVAPPR